MRSIICRVNVANDKSQKFIEKLGFTLRERVDELYTYEYLL
jgi:RimJ/RimL family protein N-acetyltransferase